MEGILVMTLSECEKAGAEQIDESAHERKFLFRKPSEASRI